MVGSNKKRLGSFAARRLSRIRYDIQMQGMFAARRLSRIRYDIQMQGMFAARRLSRIRYTDAGNVCSATA